MTPAARRSIAWAVVVAVIYLTHAAIGIHERHRMDEFMTMHAWMPLPTAELVLGRAGAVLGVVLLVAGALPPLRPARLGTALVATALPVAALLPVFVGPLRLGHQLYGFAEPRDQELMSGITVLDVLIAITAVGVAVAQVVTTSRRPAPS